MNTLYTFGCSYSEDFENIFENLHDGKKPAQLRYVDEILNGIKPMSWPKVLGHLLNYDVINKAQGGSSNPQIFENICKLSNEFKENDIVIVQWTKNNRFRWPSNYGWIPMLPNGYHNNGYNISLKTFEEILVSRSHKLYVEEIYNFQNIVTSLSTAVGFQVFYLSMDDELLIELPKNNRYLLSEQFDHKRNIGIRTVFEKNNVKTISQESNNLISDLHYGKQGHQRIAELFYDHIKNIK